MDREKNGVDKKVVDSMLDGKTKFTPSSFLRQLRPEYFSDSYECDVYELDRATFSHFLETITSRNETHNFEIFCRKLCERAVCPNLRPATGPEGGGDSRVDTETFFVSERILERVYVGEPDSGFKRWAFAFSANKKWYDKVRRDVASIAGTQRNYDRIIFVTSCLARSKARARIEDELTKEYSIPVEIHDRSWIIEETIVKNRKDLAFNYLRVGIENQRARMGPSDYPRNQQIEEIEKSIADPDSFKGIETQLVVEALLAAKLSRTLECPRIETDGRFERAIRLASKYGTHRQRLETQYETIQTAYWWYDDFELLNSSYDDFEQVLRPDERVENIEFLLTLALHLASSVIHGHFTTEECRLKDRSKKLQRRLESIAENQDSPNSAVKATTLLLHLKLVLVQVEGDVEQLPILWSELTKVLDRAKHLAEFDARGLVKLIETAGTDTVANPIYKELIRKTVEFVKIREGDVSSAQILKRRAQKLSDDQNFEKIRLLGEAARKLTKKECNDDLIDVYLLLAQSYQNVGLLWAARASCLAAVLIIQIKFEEGGDCDPRIVPIVELWAWVSLELSHLPDLVCSIEFLTLFASSFSLPEESMNRPEDILHRIDLKLASQVLNYNTHDIERLTNLPDVLNRYKLFNSRTVLLFELGYEEKLKAEEKINSEEQWRSHLDELFDNFASYTASQSNCAPVVCNSPNSQEFQTIVIGIRINVQVSGSDTSIIVAECVLGSLEVFFATLPDFAFSPHVETLDIEIIESELINKPVFSLDHEEMRAVLEWPSNKFPYLLNYQSNVAQFLLELATTVLISTCHDSEEYKTLETLLDHERVRDRISVLIGTSNGYQRFVEKPLSRLSDYSAPDDGVYTLHRESKKARRNNVKNTFATTTEPVRNHRNFGVRSVTNTYLWDRAKWIGTFFIDISEASQVPTMALVFEDREAAEKIFSQWRKRFGTVDSDEYIHIGLVKDVSTKSPFHYDVVVTTRPLDETDRAYSDSTAYPCTYKRMTPSTSENVDRFICNYRRSGAYLLTAATATNGNIELIFDLAIRKHHLSIKRYVDIKPHDAEVMLLTPTWSKD